MCVCVRACEKNIAWFLRKFAPSKISRYTVARLDSAFFKISNMRRYTAPGTYNCTWQVMNIASLDSGLERERESSFYLLHCWW